MPQHKITKVLIANRGEIALRIQRAAKKLHIKSVSIASDADKHALFARQAEELALIGPAPAKDSYLNVDKIIQTAKHMGCDAIHPGYGFLSENAEFAQRAIDAGLVFIGPSPESIRMLGSKTLARERVSAFGVPCTPGVMKSLPNEELAAEAKRIGFPVIIKAVSGGGGRGMRIAESESELLELLPRARAEALKNFSSDEVYIEKYINKPRHVEVQLFGDDYGNIIHLGTRDCSTQRRHQKLIEEAPAPNLEPSLREAIHHAAVQAARSVGYKNAGTAEFLVSGKEFYFLEMNTRIQVEHPVTEIVTGIDLVDLQFRVAMGEALPFAQHEIKFSGHAIEFRLYAENPENNFAPAVGKISELHRPVSEFLREDFGIEGGDEISVHYDAMISKIIVRGNDRTEAIEHSKSILKEYVIKGLPTTLPFHRWMLRLPTFVRGPVDIGFLEREFTAQKLKDFLVGELPDPKHRAPLLGAEQKDILEYESRKFGTRYTVEILHRADGLFVATPLLRGSRPPKNRFRRLSNGIATALRTLIEEVLEEIPADELF